MGRFLAHTGQWNIIGHDGYPEIFQMASWAFKSTLVWLFFIGHDI